ncbi:MAG: hypothetical protein RIB79_13070 [Allomuricauda sp.]|jgi:hypothetical protein
MIFVVVVPLLLFTNRLKGKELGFIILLFVYLLFNLVIASIAILSLYRWHSIKVNLINDLGKENVEILPNKKVKFNVDAFYTDIRKIAFGESLAGLTRIGFTSCDIIKFKDSMVIFGKGFNNLLPTGKSVTYPFEINFKNEFRTINNKAVLIDKEIISNNTNFKLDVSGPFGTTVFNMLIYDCV